MKYPVQYRSGLVNVYDDYPSSSEMLMKWIHGVNLVSDFKTQYAKKSDAPPILGVRYEKA